MVSVHDYPNTKYSCKLHFGSHETSIKLKGKLILMCYKSSVQEGSFVLSKSIRRLNIQEWSCLPTCCMQAFCCDTYIVYVIYLFTMSSPLCPAFWSIVCPDADLKYQVILRSWSSFHFVFCSLLCPQLHSHVEYLLSRTLFGDFRSFQSVCVKFAIHIPLRRTEKRYHKSCCNCVKMIHNKI